MPGTSASFTPLFITPMRYKILAFSFALFLVAVRTVAQDQWPLSVPAQNSTIIIYQPQPESYADGHVTARAAVALQERGKDPVYGAIWIKGFLEVDRDTRMGTLSQVEVTDVKSPGLTDSTRIKQFKDFLSAEVPKYTQPISIDRLLASLEANNGSKPDLKNSPPRIIYAETATTLVLIDGEPILKPVEGSVYDHVVNTPFLIAATKDHATYFLGGVGLWYTASSVKGPWTVTANVPKDLVGLVKQDEGEGQQAPGDDNGKPVVPQIVVSTVPAELLQTNGAADLKPVQGTQLLYVTNTDNDIFMDIASQQFYALLSGRWFAAPKLGPDGWKYIDAERLPTDFAKIPEGSPKDGVLASVPGTAAARESVLDASIPQTAKVQRTATTTITYDGEPKWRLIEGTQVYEAENASTSVLYIRKRFYACDNAVWYESDDSMGPWAVCTKVPPEVKDIPPSSPNYNVKYVQVYDSTPEVVYVGYTPGYTGCYVYGPTVVYGTGYYYTPWYGTVYYPPPVTYGFNMHYNPWTGWSMGMTVSNGWMTVHVGGYPGGWWGPPMYRPPYYRPPYHYGGGGYYGRGGNNTINIDNSTNINVGGGQGNRPGGGQGGSGKPGAGQGSANKPTTQPADRGNLYDRGKNPGVQPSRPSAGTQPAGGGRPSNGSKPGAGNNLYTDKAGNVYRTDGNTWQQQGSNGKFQTVSPGAGQATTRPSTGQTGTRPTTGQATTGQGGRGTAPAMPPATQQQLQRDQASRDRGQQRVNNYQGRPSPSAGSYGGGARGGAAPRGGGGGRR